MNGSTSARHDGGDGYDVAYLTKYFGKRDSGIAFTDRFYLDALSRSALSTLVVGNVMPSEYPGDGLAYTTSGAHHRASRVRLHVVNGLGSYVTHQGSGWFPEHAGSRKVAILHDEPQAFDFYATDVWNRAHVRDVLMAAQDDFVFVSRRSRDLWVQEAGIADERTFVVPNTCAEEALIARELAGRDRRSLGAELALPEDRFEVVVVATVQQRKAQLDVVEAVRRLRHRRPDLPVHLSVVGRVSQPSYGAELAAFVRRHDLADAVTLVGEVPKARALQHIAAAHCLVLASHSESMPLVLLEAMQLGTPVVATRVGGVPELLDDDQAWLVDAGDVEAIAAGVERLADDAGWGAGLASRGRDRYWAEFSNEQFHRRFDVLMRELAVRSGIAALPAPVADVGGVRLESARDGDRIVLEVRGVPVADGGVLRATIAAWHADAPFDVVRWRTEGVGLAGQLALTAPFARLGLELTQADAGGVTLERGRAVPWLTRTEHLAAVGGPGHEASYAVHVRASRRRERAKAAEQLASVRTPTQRARSVAGRARRLAGRLVRRARSFVRRRPEVALVVVNSPMQALAALTLWDARFARPGVRLVAAVHSTTGAEGFASRLVETCRALDRFDAVVDVTEQYAEVYARRPDQAVVDALRDATLAGHDVGDVTDVLVAAFMSARAQKAIYEAFPRARLRLFEDGLGSYVPKRVRTTDRGLTDRITGGDCAQLAHVERVASVDLMLTRLRVPGQYGGPAVVGERLPEGARRPVVRTGSFRIDYAAAAVRLGVSPRAFDADQVLVVTQNFVDHLGGRGLSLLDERAVNDAVIARVLAGGRRVVVRPHPRASAPMWSAAWDADPRVEVWQDEPMTPVEVLVDPAAPPAAVVGASSSCLFYLGELVGLTVRRYPDEQLDVLRACATAEHRYMLDLAASAIPPLEEAPATVGHVSAGSGGVMAAPR